MTYILRPFRGEEDLQPIGALLSASQSVDRLVQPTTHERLRDDLLKPTGGWRRDVGLWERETDGQLMGFALIWSPPQDAIRDAYFWFLIHPEARDSDLVDCAFAWAEERTRATSGPDATLTVSASEDDRWRHQAISRFDFTIERYFLRMRRDLQEPLPAITIPDGYAIRPIAGPEETEQWVDLFNSSWADHWEHIDLTVDERRVEQSQESYRPDLDLVAVAPDGTFAGFCSGTVSRMDDGQFQPWISLVGTHAAHRRRGLARALIATAFSAFHAEGFKEAFLSVDADSPTSAGSVYEALGFRVLQRITVFRRPVGAA